MLALKLTKYIWNFASQPTIFCADAFHIFFFTTSKLKKNIFRLILFKRERECMCVVVGQRGR